MICTELKDVFKARQTRMIMVRRTGPAWLGNISGGRAGFCSGNTRDEIFTDRPGLVVPSAGEVGWGDITISIFLFISTLASRTFEYFYDFCSTYTLYSLQRRYHALISSV